MRIIASIDSQSGISSSAVDIHMVKIAIVQIDIKAICLTKEDFDCFINRLGTGSRRRCC